MIKKKGDGRGPVVPDDYVYTSLRRADIAWAQAGIDVDMIEGLSEKDHIKFRQMLIKDYSFDLPSPGQINPNDISIVYSTLRWDLNIVYQTDILYVIFTGGEFWPNNVLIRKGKSSLMGIACYPRDAAHPHPFWNFDEYFAFIETGNEIEWRVLAHEIGHILSRKGDIRYNDPWKFFPQYYSSDKDDHVEYNRRLRDDLVDIARQSDYAR